MPRHHLVKLKRPFLDLILDGRKTIESRFTKLCRAPWDRIGPGDVLWLKESGGPIRGTAKADRVEQHAGLTQRKIRRLLRRHGEAIGVGPEYADALVDKQFGILVWLRDVRPLVPVPWPGGTMVAWVVLPRPPYLERRGPAWQPARDTISIPVTGGMLRTRYIPVRAHLDFFPGNCVGEQKRGGRLGWPILLELADVGTFPTDILAETRAFRLRGPVARFFEHHGVTEGDVLALRHVADRHFRCDIRR